MNSAKGDWGAQCYEHGLGLSGLWDPSKFQDVGKFQIRFVGRAGAGGEREYPGRAGPENTKSRGKRMGWGSSLRKRAGEEGCVDVERLPGWTVMSTH